jgi:hypothetical protein
MASLGKLDVRGSPIGPKPAHWTYLPVAVSGRERVIVAAGTAAWGN